MEDKLEALLAKWECRRRAVCRDIDDINFFPRPGMEKHLALYESAKSTYDEFIADLEKLSEIEAE